MIVTEHEFWAVLPTVVAYAAGILSGMRIRAALARPSRHARVPQWIVAMFETEGQA